MATSGAVVGHYEVDQQEKALPVKSLNGWTRHPKTTRRKGTQSPRDSTAYIVPENSLLLIDPLQGALIGNPGITSVPVQIGYHPEQPTYCVTSCIPRHGMASASDTKAGDSGHHSQALVIGQGPQNRGIARGWSAVNTRSHLSFGVVSEPSGCGNQMNDQLGPRRKDNNRGVAEGGRLQCISTQSSTQQWLTSEKNAHIVVSQSSREEHEEN